ncbi:MAG TPA: response regulator [Actinomycetota bacterium]|nr:response regulator [Actinomycetota bacterium]
MPRRENEDVMRRVLVIEDEADVRLLYRVNLRHAGFEVLESDDGDHGIDAARTHLPDAVVLDLMMPRTDGFEVLEALRSARATRDIPVIVLTADVRTEDHQRCYELGADVVVTKPFSPETLTNGLHRLLDATYEDRLARRAEAVASTGTAFR